MFLVEFEGDIFEVGGFVIYFKNLYSLKFMEFLGLNWIIGDDDDSFGIWDGI